MCYRFDIHCMQSSWQTLSFTNPQTGEPSRGGRDFYVMLLAISQLFVFFLQDATTITIWWNTGAFCDGEDLAPANRTVAECFGKASLVASGNMIITLISAAFASVCIVTSMARLVTQEGVCNLGNFILAIVIPLYVLKLRNQVLASHGARLCVRVSVSAYVFTARSFDSACSVLVLRAWASTTQTMSRSRLTFNLPLRNQSTHPY